MFDLSKFTFTKKILSRVVAIVYNQICNQTPKKKKKFVTKLCPSHFRACAQWTKYSSCSCLSPSMIKDTNDTNLFITCLHNELWVLELWTHVDSSFFPNHSTRHVGKLWQKLYHLAFFTMNKSQSLAFEATL